MEGDSDFFIYLNSGFNKEEFKNNSVSEFTNLIHPNNRLNGNYDVGLRNIIFNPDFYAVEKNDDEYKIDVTIGFFDANDVFVTATQFIYKPSYDIRANDVGDLIVKINKDLIKLLKSRKVIDDKQDSIFKYDFHYGVVGFDEMILTPEFINGYNKLEDSMYSKVKMVYRCGKKMVDVLGLEFSEFLNKPSFAKPPKMPMNSYMFYIFSDIVTNSHFGSQQVNLLDVFPLPNAYAKSTNFTMYKSVSKQTLTDISIKITDQFGKKLRLSSNSDMLIVLHFKRVYD